MKQQKPGSPLRRFLRALTGVNSILIACTLVGVAFFIYHYRREFTIVLSNNTGRHVFLDTVVTWVEYFVQTYVLDFMTLALSILVEATPFVVLGVLISVVIQVFLPMNKIVARLPRNTIIRRAIVSSLGLCMPVCECGNVPVARSLMAKGFSIQEAIVFLLAAPSVNIITFIVTWEVFSQNHSIAIVRVLGTIVIANIIASLVARVIAPKNILTPDFAAYCKSSTIAPRSLSRATNLFRTEMWLIIRLLVIGALIAAASQIFIPQEVIAAIGSNTLLSVLAMFALAFIISICSSVDSFFALAYANMFGPGAILTFLLAGPMVDIKMITLMKSTFTYRTIAVIASCVFVLSCLIGVVFSYVW